LIAKINRTNYPEIFKAPSVLDRALRVLRLAEEDFGVEFLSAPEIAQVLKDKFRLPTTHQAVRQALGARPQFVDTRQVKRGYRGRAVVAYRIMSPGAEFLDAGGTASDEETPRRAPKRRQTSRKQTSTKRQSEAGQRERANGASRQAARATSASTSRSRVGPKRALAELIAEGFFDESRTIADAKERLRHKKGLNFKVQDLSPALVRLLREGSLDREQGEGGQYEYRRP
jgi:flagellar biosynthesis GTPase FlhF